MKIFLKPFWWICVFLIPQILLFFYEYSIYSIVKTEEATNLRTWAWLAGIQGLTFLLVGGYLLFAFLKKKSTHWVLPVLMIVSQIGFLFWFFAHEHDLISWSVPRWMVERDEFSLLLVALGMPAIFFAILQLVSYTITEEGKKRLPLNIGLMLLVPLGWYLYIAVLVPMVNRYNYGYGLFDQLIMILAIVSLVFFFFLLIRLLMLLGAMMGKKPLIRIIFVTICCLVAPILGLWINGGANNWGESNIFGDFSHWAFFALTIVNALLLLIPATQQRWAERTLTAFRFATLPFSFYFLIVFIPFLPLSIAAMLAAGAGILLLAPVVNFILHVYRLYQDLSNKELFPTPISRWLITSPVLVLPLLVHLNYRMDRNDLRNAMTWIYNPDYSEKTTDVDPDRISYILEIVTNTANNRSAFFGRKYWKPYLSTYYRWLVLDNLTLSGKKVSDLEQTFVGTSHYRSSSPWVERSSPDVTILSSSTETKTDPSGKFYHTTLHLELNNPSDQQQEFITSLQLPEDAWVSDYYLDIGEKREHGILAEKRTAQWVYRNIVNRRKDPGIISYRHGNKLELRVFPMEPKEVRRTGIELIHNGPLKFELGNSTVEVNKPSLSVLNTNTCAILTEQEKRNLSSQVRKKKYYLLIDNSKAVTDSSSPKKEILDRVQNDLNVLLAANGPIQLYAVTHSAHSLNLKAWRPLAEQLEPEGGFFAERIMKSILVDHYTTMPDYAPVFLIYANNPLLLSEEFMNLQFTFPDVDRFFISSSETAFDRLYNSERVQNDSDTIVRRGNSAAKLAVEYKPTPVCFWPGKERAKRAIPAEGSSFIYTGENYTELTDADNLWTKAITEQGNVTFLQLHPELSETYWRKLVAQNFETGILSPYTSYLVVETEAQKEVLRQKQKEVLNAAQYFDIEQEFISMAEPAWYWYLSIPLVLWYLKKRRDRTSFREVI